MILIGGQSHPHLAQTIAAKIGCPYLFSHTQTFANQELKIAIHENLEDQEVVLLQSTSHPTHDHLMELFLLADTAKKAGCRKLTAIIPYFGYGRQDRPSYKNGPISASLVARLIESSGIDRVITVDMHSQESAEFFNIEFNNVDPMPIFRAMWPENGSFIVVSPDRGGLPRARLLSDQLQTDMAIIDKKRASNGQCMAHALIGSVENKDCIIIDDILDSGHTLYAAQALLFEKGARSVSACITHAVCSPGWLDRISPAHYDRFFVSDTIYHAHLPSHIHRLCVSDLIAHAL